MVSSSDSRRRAVVIGAGPAGLMAAEVLATAGWQVEVHDRMPSVGRKLLMAGRGGLNLTHSEPLDEVLARYSGGNVDRLKAAITAFPPAAVVAWAEGLGQETFVGSSGRIFPKAMKASPLLRAWLRRLDALGVRFQLRSRWLGFDPAGDLRFAGPEGETIVARPDATIIALGGASWPRLGSDAGWVGIFAELGAQIQPMRPANCGFAVDWSPVFREKFAGMPLKRVAVRLEPDAAHPGAVVAAKGEALVTSEGLEGGVIYELSSRIRDRLEHGPVTILIDQRPDIAAEALAARLASARKGDSLSNVLRKAAGLSPVAVGLLREAHGADLPKDPARLAALIKAVPVILTRVGAIERAISTAGGVDFAGLDDHFMLANRPGVFVAGEMLDWEAPTGGYLLQATFSTAVAAAKGAINWAESDAANGAVSSD